MLLFVLAETLRTTRNNRGRRRTSHGRSRTPAPTIKRNVCHNPVGDRRPRPPTHTNKQPPICAERLFIKN